MNNGVHLSQEIKFSFTRLLNVMRVKESWALSIYISAQLSNAFDKTCLALTHLAIKHTRINRQSIAVGFERMNLPLLMDNQFKTIETRQHIYRKDQQQENRQRGREKQHSKNSPRGWRAVRWFRPPNESKDKRQPSAWRLLDLQ